MFAMDMKKFIEGPSHCLVLPPELKSAMNAITFIAEQLQDQEDYDAVSEWPGRVGRPQTPVLPPSPQGASQAPMFHSRVSGRICGT